MVSKIWNEKWGNWIVLGAVALSMLPRVAVAGPEEDTVQAEKEFARGNLMVALDLWRKAADLGYAPAQVWLGNIHDKTEEDELAVAWYRKAAAQNDAAGELALGEMYAKGEGVEKDNAQAYNYISRAAEKGYLQAAIAMREIYRRGTLGMTVDAAKSAEWDAKVNEITAREALLAKSKASTSANTQESTDKK